VLLFGVPALLASIIAAAVMLAASAGVLWLFVFGDNPWPPVADTLLGTVFVLSGVGLWAALLSVAYAVGRRQEAQATLNTRHLALSIGATVVLVAVIVVRFMGLNIVGTRSDDIVCADFCRAEGFAGSGMPPKDSGDRTCSCYDGQGRVARQVPLSELAPENR